MNKDTETMKHNAEVAQFRFALIAPVIQGLYNLLLHIEHHHMSYIHPHT